MVFQHVIMFTCQLAVKNVGFRLDCYLLVSNGSNIPNLVSFLFLSVGKQFRDVTGVLH